LYLQFDIIKERKILEFSSFDEMSKKFRKEKIL